MKGDPEASCRFGFPKPMAEMAMFDSEDHAIYRRGVADVFVNPYSPVLLALFETNMDIQVSAVFDR